VDFWDLTKLLVRRWYVAVPLLLLTAVGAVGLASTIKPDYIADSYVTMVPPSVISTNANSGGKSNPWLDTGLTTLGSAAIYTTQDTSVLDRLKREGYSDNVVLAFDGNSPIIKIEVTGNSKDQARGTSQQVAQMFSDNVKALQSEYSIPDAQLITTRRLDLGDNVKASTTKLKRAVIAVVGAGLLMTIALTAGVDAVLGWRSRRRSPLGGSVLAAQDVRRMKLDRVGGPSGGTSSPGASDRSNGGGSNGAMTELIPITPGAEPPERTERQAPAGRDSRAGAQGKGGEYGQGKGGEYRSATRDAAEAAVFTDAESPAERPMPSDATIILPMSTEKEDWAVRDGGGGRGVSNRR
jgi:capsular polysaccharide biosynthesis protein